MILTEERVIPKLMNPTNGLLKEHIVRYEFAARFAKGRVLDIACGVGYGASILIETLYGRHIEKIIGVDSDEESIRYAREHYNGHQVEYFTMDALAKNLDKQLGLFDTIISFETIEHLEEDVLFIEHLNKLLKPGGTLIISTPFGRGRALPCTNPFHMHQYKEEEFLEMLSDFEQVEMYHQINGTIELPLKNKKYYLMIAVCRQAKSLL